MAKEKTLLDEETLKAAKEMDEIAKEISDEGELEKVNGDFQRLMEKDVALNPEIQGIITAENGKCDKLSDDQKAEYGNWLSIKMGVSPDLRPIDFIPTKNGIKPYLNKSAAELIRDARSISITDLTISEQNGMYLVICNVRDTKGRIDSDIGAWPKGNELHNSLMKAVTKAKRRATLSICRLGGLIEEAHPTEYNNSAAQEQCRSAVLLEDESKVKKTFRDVVLSKVERDDLPKEIFASLLEQAGHLANTNSVAEAAKWLQERGEISVTSRKDVVTKAVIKEVKNEAG